MVTSQPLASGSSPRVRGKGKNSASRLGLSGIIPAGAGKSLASFVGQITPQDHPRGCGEKRLDDEEDILPEGSSPRVRGKAFLILSRKSASRIIPAGAGKRLFRRSYRDCKKDHPRGCGEKD